MRYTTIRDLRNHVDSMVGNGGGLETEEVERVIDHITAKIRCLEGFEYGRDMTELMEGITDEQWDTWISKALAGNTE